MKIDSYGKSYGSFVQGRFRLLFSPDSTRIAVRSPRYLEEKEDLKVYRDPPDSYPYLFVQSIPGWARLWIQVITDKKPYMPGQTVVLEASNYLVDYEGKQFIRMKKSDSPGGAWYITPDGKKLVYFNRSIFLDEEPVHLPAKPEKPVP